MTVIPFYGKLQRYMILKRMPNEVNFNMRFNSKLKLWFAMTNQHTQVFNFLFCTKPKVIVYLSKSDAAGCNNNILCILFSYNRQYLQQRVILLNENYDVNENKRCCIFVLPYVIISLPRMNSFYIEDICNDANFRQYTNCISRILQLQMLFISNTVFR